MGIPPELLSSEKQPQLDYTEPEAPSPSTYLDLPPAPHIDNAKDDLSYISRMLMGEDIVDKLYHHQYPNHPMLVTAEQSFAQILSGATSDDLTTWTCHSTQQTPLQLSVATTPVYYSYCDMIASEMLPSNNVDSMHVYQDASSSLLMNSMHEAAAVEPNRLLPAESSSSSSIDVISMAFFKGMEEANKLLPSKDNESETLDRDRGRKKRLQGKDDEDIGIVGNMP